MFKYLGLIGCGCYDKDGEIEKVFFEGFVDCIVDVWIVVVEVI